VVVAVTVIEAGVDVIDAVAVLDAVVEAVTVLVTVGMQ
jgi:hypothetical protein